MKKDYAKTADTLIAALGGKENITRLFHCMTRLRFYVKDRSKINEKEILKLSEISGVNWHEDQFQVIAGNEVNAVYKALEDKGVPTDDAPAANSDSSKSVVSKVIDAMVPPHFRLFPLRRVSRMGASKGCAANCFFSF